MFNRVRTSPGPLWTLAQQFGLAHFFTVVVAIVAVSLMVFFVQREVVQQMFSRIDTRRGDSFADLCQAALVQKNPALISVYLQLLHKSDDVDYAYYADAEGIVRYHMSPDGVGERIDPKAKSSQYEFRLPIPAGGWAVLGINASFRRSVIRRTLLQASVGVVLAGALAMALGFFVSMALARRLARPIQMLRRSAYAIGEGKFSTRVATGHSREVQQLADVFNKMAERLEETDRIKDDILSMVTHDLRTPLAAITSVLDVLLQGGRGPLSEVHQDYLGIVRENASALLRFVNDTLDLAKVKAGKMDYHPALVDLGAVVERVFGLFETLARQKGVAMENRIPSSVFVRTDQEKLDHILVNLISNGLKHAPAETGKIHVSAAKRGELVEVCVADNGPGISAEGLSEIFQKFVTVSQGAAPVSQGTGLGLVVVRTFVEAQGGKVAVESALGKGSVFSFTVPAALGSVL